MGRYTESQRPNCARAIDRGFCGGRLGGLRLAEYLLVGVAGVSYDLLLPDLCALSRAALGRFVMGSQFFTSDCPAGFIKAYDR